ncbi:MAG: hypothetical protein IGS03_14770 [Candidatus Sericytochromatia bacterium]|nr:hypothetical protein [Candidatus Sericytochromatia bacterium]
MYIGNMMGTGLHLGMDAQAGNINKSAVRMAKSATPRLPALAVAGGPRAGAGSGSIGGGSITFAPVIQISAAPGQSTANQVQQAVQDLYPQFVQLMRRYEADQRRTVPA